MFSDLITLFYNDGFTCLAYVLACLSIGFIAGWRVQAYKFACITKAKTLPNTSSFTHCDIIDKHEYIAFTEPKLFFKPKITKCSCPHYHKGTCAKSNKTCILISQYSDNYFKSL